MISTSDWRTMLHDPKLKRFLAVMTLCMAAIVTILALGFLGVAFATDNWKHIAVNRVVLSKIVEESNDTKLEYAYMHDHRYFDRVEGNFRVCFPMAEKPRRVNDDIYLSPMQEWCTNIDYYMNTIQKGFMPDKMTYNGGVWINMARATVGAFIIYFALMGVACVVGLTGCWSFQPINLMATSIFMFIAFVFACAGIGLFHGASYYERYKVLDVKLGFYQTWEDHLKANTRFNLGWSYIIALFGIVLTLISSLLYAAAAFAIRVTKESNEEEFHQAIVNSGFEAEAYLDTYNRQAQGSLHGTLSRMNSMVYLGGINVPPGLHNFEGHPSYLMEDIPKKEFSDARL